MALALMNKNMNQYTLKATSIIGSFLYTKFLANESDIISDYEIILKHEEDDFIKKQAILKLIYLKTKIIKKKFLK
jgi:hypothetical protein